MSSFDNKVPEELKIIQDWFASIITMPIDDQNRLNPLSPSGNMIAEEAREYILPSPTLAPHERMQIYNQQYWWRLLGILHDNFPLTVRLLGYRQFNRVIAMPYLTEHPPNHWSLNYLGDTLPVWVRQKYRSKDKALITEVIDVDWAYVYSFFSAEQPFIDIHQTAMDSCNDSILNEKIFLQPHLHLFALEHNLLPFRDTIIEKPPEHWEEHGLPELKKAKKYHFVIYRNQQCRLIWIQIDPYEYKLLENFKKGSTIEHACQWLEKQDQQFLQKAAENLHLWFQEWTVRKWLCQKPDTTGDRTLKAIFD